MDAGFRSDASTPTPASLAALRESKLVTGLSAEVAGALSSALRPLAAEMGEVLAVQGEPGDSIILVESGQVEVVIDGNSVWHFPLANELKDSLHEVMADLGATGFDPFVGSKLRSYAQAADLGSIVETIEPYHRIVGRPDDETADQWRRKILGLKQNYIGTLFPQKKHMVDFFDEMLDFVLDENTMTWSNLHIVQGTKSAH